MSLLHHGLTLAQRWVPSTSAGTCVLAYHLVGGATATVVDVPLDEFRRQLDWLSENCDVVSLDDALMEPTGPRRRVVLTFDDAYRNFMERAWPELSERGLPAILYTPVGFVDGTSPPPLRGAELPALSFAQLRELCTAGLTIGSHGLTHRNLRLLSETEVARELCESKRRLEQELSVPVQSFCYPQAKLNEEVARLAAQHYRSAVSAGGRPFKSGSLLTIPRYPVRRNQADFKQMVGSGLWLHEAIAHQLRQFRA